MFKKCIFCRSILSASTRKEHIINASIGGALTSRALVCNSCNEYFSKNIDLAISDKYSMALNILSPVMKGTSHIWQAKLKESDKSVLFAPGMVPIPKEKPIIDKEMGKVKGFYAKTDNAEKMREALEIINPGGRIIQRYEVYKELDMPIRRMTLVTDDELRVIAKTSLEYLMHASKGTLHLDLFGGIVNYVRNSGIPEVRLAFLSATLDSVNRQFDKFNKPTDFCHRIVVSVNGPVIEAAIILFERIAYRVVLSDKYSGPEFAYLYQRNILKGAASDYFAKLEKSLLCGEFLKGDKDAVADRAIADVVGLCRDGYWFVDLNCKENTVERYCGGIIAGKSNGDLIAVTGAEILNLIFDYTSAVFSDRKEDPSRKIESEKIKRELLGVYGGLSFNEIVPNLSGALRDVIWELHLKALRMYKQYFGSPLYGIRHFGIYSD